MAEVAQEEQEKDMNSEEEKEFQLREQVRLRMEAQIQSELKKIKEKVSTKFTIILFKDTYFKPSFRKKLKVVINCIQLICNLFLKSPRLHLHSHKSHKR